MPCEIYVVMTSRQTWGKGPDPVIALYHACPYGDIEQAQFYRFTFPDGFSLPDGQPCDKWWQALIHINVDEMGIVTHPKGVKPEDLGVMRITGIPARFTTIKSRVNDHVSRKSKG